MTDELIDIYDENLNPMGTALKSVAHRNKLWHCVFFCWIVRGNNVLFQRRALMKESHPGKLDISAAGHLQAGETETDGVREVREELGLTPNLRDLIKLETDKWTHSAEFCHTYLMKFNGNLTDLVLQREEVSAVFEIDIDAAIALFDGRVRSIRANGVECDENGLNSSVSRTLSLSDFVAHKGNYFLRILKKIKTFL